MNITIYRGTHEIGGTLIELCTKHTRLLIDAGYPLFLNNQPIDDKVSGYPPDKLMKLGVLPAIKGLYKWDTPAFDAVLISHAHIDHYGLLKYIHPNIPVYLSRGTKAIIEISTVFEITDACPHNIHEFSMYELFSIGDFTVKPFLMDHSAFDAAAFELSVEGKTVIYTGDFRGHGRKAVCLERFIHGAHKDAELLLTEGSMLGRLDEKVLTEDELEKEAVKIIENVDGITLFQCSSQNIDRLVSFYKAAKSRGKLFVIDIYTANVLYELRQLGNRLPYPSEEYPGIRVFYPYRLTNKIFNSIGEEYAKRFSAFHLSKDELSRSQSRIVMAVRPSMQRDLERCALQGGSFIYSMWQGYRNSNYQKNFEDYLVETGFGLNFIHTSGHARVEDIKAVMTGLNPKLIIPIHTMFPEAFLDFSDRVQVEEDGMKIKI